MKKVLIAVLLLFALSACETQTETDKCGENGEWVSTTLTPSNDGYCKYDGYVLDNLEYEYLKASMICDANDLDEPECEVVGYYTQAEVDAKIEKLETEIEALETELTKKTVLMEVLTGAEYNTTELQCDTSDDFICYNDNFIYKIYSNDYVLLIFGVYNEYRIDLVLERQDDGDFYYIELSYWTQEDYLVEEYDIYQTSHFSSTAIELVADVIEDGGWDFFIGDGDDIFNTLKVRFEIDE